MRRFRSCVERWLGHLISLAISPFFQWVFHRFTAESFDGIRIVDLRQQDIDKRFRVRTVAALRLIKSVDPKRFRRIQRQVKFVINNDMMFPKGRYARAWRLCEVDYRCFDTDKHDEWHTWRLATTIVHEATHGHLQSRHIAYTAALRGRIERLCHAEEKRFAKKADTAERPWSQAICGEFDERKWHRYWNMTRWQTVKMTIARIREANRTTNK